MGYPHITTQNVSTACTWSCTGACTVFADLHVHVNVILLKMKYMFLLPILCYCTQKDTVHALLTALFMCVASIRCTVHGALQPTIRHFSMCV